MPKYVSQQNVKPVYINHANKWKKKSLLNSSVHLIVAKPQVFIKLDINVYDVCMKRPKDNFSYS